MYFMKHKTTRQLDSQKAGQRESKVDGMLDEARTLRLVRETTVEHCLYSSQGNHFAIDESFQSEDVLCTK